jgi:hypothetical protein
MGQEIVLRLAAAGLQAPVPGIIVGESENAVRFRIGQGWDIDIPKSMILAVEEDSAQASLNAYRTLRACRWACQTRAKDTRLDYMKG